MAGHSYVISGVATANAAAPKDFLSVKAAANQRVKVRSIHFGHDGAVAAQGVRWQLLIFASGQTDVTSSAFTPVAVDQGDTRTAKCTAKDTVTVQASGTSKKVFERAFDILSSLTYTFPPGAEPLLEDGQFIVPRKIVGADATGNWAVDIVVEE